MRLAVFEDIQNRLLHDVSSAPLRYGAIAVIVLTLLWLPLGVMAFAGWLWLCRLVILPAGPGSEGQNQTEASLDEVFSPITGRVLAVRHDSASGVSRLFCKMNWDASHLVLMPVSGEITENFSIDGAFQELLESVFEDMASLPINARRDIQIKQKNGRLIDMIFWGLPHCRYLASPLNEGAFRKQGAVAGLTLLHGVIELRLPAGATLCVGEGRSLQASESLLARYSNQQ